jgi:hypothetical protein
VYGVLGIDSSQVEAQVETFEELFVNLVSGSGGNLKLLILGGIVFVYTKYRASVKRTEAVAATKKPKTEEVTS